MRRKPPTERGMPTFVLLAGTCFNSLSVARLFWQGGLIAGANRAASKTVRSSPMRVG